ncbi:MAG: glutamate racemase [Hydrogenophaga sp.]|nr:glutamate racemase [Hydrogenophaga sp.]MDZ4214990.1 glutamate racemase [Rhodocyclaceae bacterium]
MKKVGVFDSGVGGLSVLRALLNEIPEAAFVYVADSAYAPYGERSRQEIIERSRRIADYLMAQHAIDALVVACNTATAQAIDKLRQTYPDMPIVGVEPALKTAAALSRSGHIGVLATRGTLHSERFAQLRERMESATAHPVHFNCQPCDGLADAIERDDAQSTRILCQRYLHALRTLETDSTPIDTLVLGCTHYPFAADVLTELGGPGIQLVETGVPVARRTRAVLGLEGHAVNPVPPHTDLQLMSTGDPEKLTQAAQRWLKAHVKARAFVC